MLFMTDSRVLVGGTAMPSFALVCNSSMYRHAARPPGRCPMAVASLAAAGAVLVDSATAARGSTRVR